VKEKILFYLLQCFNDYEVPLEMTAEEVKNLLTKFIEDYKEELICPACGIYIRRKNDD
jgi:hypothetical protein